MAPATLHPTDHPHPKHAGLLRRKELFAWAQAAMEIAWTSVYVSVRRMKSIGWNQEQIMHMVCKLIISQWLHRSTRFPIARWMVVGILILLQTRWLKPQRSLFSWIFPGVDISNLSRCFIATTVHDIHQVSWDGYCSTRNPNRSLQDGCSQIRNSKPWNPWNIPEIVQIANIKSTVWRVLTRLTPSNCNYFPGTNQ